MKNPILGCSFSELEIVANLDSLVVFIDHARCSFLNRELNFFETSNYGLSKAKR